jgi:hypothetical protein
VRPRTAAPVARAHFQDRGVRQEQVPRERKRRIDDPLPCRIKRSWDAVRPKRKPGSSPERKDCGAS